MEEIVDRINDKICPHFCRCCKITLYLIIVWMVSIIVYYTVALSAYVLTYGSDDSVMFKEYTATISISVIIACLCIIYLNAMIGL